MPSQSVSFGLVVQGYAPGLPLAAVLGINGQVWGVVVLPDGRYAVSAGDDQTLRLWQLSQ